jgi:pleiotropic regulator 1
MASEVANKVQASMESSRLLFADANPFISPPVEEVESFKFNLKSRYYETKKVLAPVANPFLANSIPSQKLLLLTNADSSSSGGAKSGAGATSSSSSGQPEQRLQAYNGPGAGGATGSRPTGSTALTVRHAKPVPTPQWHAPWELSAVISGHLGWVRSIAFDPSNEWFATGSADRFLASISVFYVLSNLHLYFECVQDNQNLGFGKVLCWC